MVKGMISRPQTMHDLYLHPIHAATYYVVTSLA